MGMDVPACRAPNTVCKDPVGQTEMTVGSGNSGKGAVMEILTEESGGEEHS